MPTLGLECSADQRHQVEAIEAITGLSAGRSSCIVSSLRRSVKRILEECGRFSEFEVDPATSLAQVAQTYHTVGV